MVLNSCFSQETDIVIFILLLRQYLCTVHLRCTEDLIEISSHTGSRWKINIERYLYIVIHCIHVVYDYYNTYDRGFKDTATAEMMMKRAKKHRQPHANTIKAKKMTG